MFDFPTTYCELLSHLATPEPLNVISNLAFFVAAWLVWRTLQPRSLPERVLPVLLGIVGVASAWWHLFHTSAGDTADTLSVAIFAIAAAAVFLYNIIPSRSLVSIAVALLAALALGAERLHWLNGSIPYIVLLLAFGVGGIAYVKKFPKKRRLVMIAFATFALAIVCRSIDLASCPFILFGTHFLWHVLVAAFGYQLILLATHKPDARSVLSS